VTIRRRGAPRHHCARGFPGTGLLGGHALSPLVFFQKGSIHTMIFVPNADGAIREVLEEHKFNEVAMQRVP
jgi:hypothetical protein